LGGAAIVEVDRAGVAVWCGARVVTVVVGSGMGFRDGWFVRRCGSREAVVVVGVYRDADGLAEIIVGPTGGDPRFL
jgi:hypothetical protein